MSELSSIIIPEPKIIVSKGTDLDIYVDKVLADCSRYKPIKQYVVYRNSNFFKLKEEVDTKIEKEPSFEVAGITNLTGISKDEYVCVLVEYLEETI
jgi:hypothetical protein